MIRETDVTETRLLTALIAIVMLAGGITHLVAPQIFYPIVPSIFPARLAVLGSGLGELAIGVAVLVPRLRARAGLAFALLCIAYLPLHLWDFLRPDPIFHPWPLAVGRVLLQVGFIVAGLRLSRQRSPACPPSFTVHDPVLTASRPAAAVSAPPRQST
jgi:uncharacterized membrane protein